MPAKNRVGREKRADLSERLAAKNPAFHGQPAALVTLAAGTPASRRHTTFRPTWHWALNDTVPLGGRTALG
ncbi:MAG: hypothetical protein ACYSWU_20790, partial [Planctomycetota bacterium]